MHYEIVDGYPMPGLFAGHPALELCNTWAGWETRPTRRGQGDRGREYLADFDRFAVWTEHVGLLDHDQAAHLQQLGRESPLRAGRTLRQVWRLREALHDVVLDPDATDAFATVTELADRAARSSSLARDAHGVVSRRVDPAVGIAHGLLVTAQAAEQLLGDPVSATVRACPGHDCGWVFLDPRGRRRWCSMSSCGNRAKVRAHAARRA
jgi:predicted RNA-binding Zn ribbon-like protein